VLLGGTGGGSSGERKEFYAHTNEFPSGNPKRIFTSPGKRRNRKSDDSPD
jgi:hypothetical protein